MKMADWVDSANQEWRCPVCGQTKGSSGPFVSPWALACHIAGKALARDALHKAWIDEVPDVGRLPRTVPKLAERIQDRVIVTVRASYASQLYLWIAEIEVSLHQFIRKKLEEDHGPDEGGWWDKGVPLSIRQECAKRRESTIRKQEPYNYTDLVDLKQILDKNWSAFQRDFRKIERYYRSKREFLGALQVLNEVRNMVMHPVRGASPTQEELMLLRTLHAAVLEFAT